MSRQYETVIGLEIHVELATKTKIFCGCKNAFGGKVNAHTCPVCTGMPGSLPVLNKQVVEYAIAVGVATNCRINRCCKFDRKNYFYPDNPQNYQISQLYVPICEGGGVEIDTPEGSKVIRIHEIHMEEDAGKLIHDVLPEGSLVDYNRSGVPLIEIVSEPDMSSADEVIEYLEKLRMIIQYLGVSDCKLQEGSMRADVNLSVREVGSSSLGTRTEMKNLNSFKAIRRAIAHETSRQIDIIEAGGEVTMETRRWDDNEGYSYAMRSKEDSKDYRYFPEPDLMPVKISEDWIERIRNNQPELPRERKERYVKDYNLSNGDVELIISDKHLADIFEETVAICNKPKEVVNWLMVEAMRLLKEQQLQTEDISFDGINLARLIELVASGEINRTVAKEVFEVIFRENIDPVVYVKEKGLGMVSDEVLVQQTVQDIIRDTPQSVADYKAGKDKAIGYIVGQVMKAMRGKANPAVVNKLVKQELDK